MCLGIPMKIVSITGDRAEAVADGMHSDISIQVIDEVKVGDFVLVHAGYAIEIVQAEEAEETLDMLRVLLNVKKPDGEQEAP